MSETTPQPISTANPDQEAYWNGAMGETWVASQAEFDQTFSEITAELVARAAPRPGERAIDLGCGAGATALALAVRVGPGGHVLGVDISETMLAEARRRAAGLSQIALLRADAQTHAFAPGAADLLVSRFGSMFFGDPVRAFANLLSALRPGGRVHLACWAPAEENPWFAESARAASARCGVSDPVRPGTPGPFGFAERDYAAGVLSAAGFAAVAAEAVPLSLTPPGSPAEVARMSVRLGPAARILKRAEGGAADAEAIAAALEPRFAAFQASDGAVRIPALLNFFSAEAP